MRKTRIAAITVLCLCIPVFITCIVSLPKQKTFKCKFVSYHVEEKGEHNKFILTLLTDKHTFDLEVDYDTYSDAKYGQKQMYFDISPTLVYDYWKSENNLAGISFLLGITAIVVLCMTKIED